MLTPLLGPHIPDCQNGFTEVKSTIQALRVLHDSIIESLSVPAGRVYAVFVDFQKAFDSVPRDQLIIELKNLNCIPIELLNMVATMLEIIFMQFHDGLSVSDPIVQSNGVLQGNPCSPLLFNIFIADLPEFITTNNNKLL
jgi:hypothetical protein